MIASKHRPAAWSRRLVLGLAVLLALATAAAWRSPVAPAWVTPALAQTAAPPAKAKAAKPAAPEAAPDAESTDSAEAKVGVTIGSDKKVVVSTFGHKDEYDSFADFIDQAPWIAGLVFLVVTLIFLAPLLVIVLVIWYKMRKNRMLNETMLKLAEKGVVPPAEALEALAGNRAAESLHTGTATAPLYEQAKALRKRNSWSDLRKGVIMAAVGFGLQAWSILDDGTANGIGLVLLFVGLGYIVLWFFEERQPAPRSDAGRGD